MRGELKVQLVAVVVLYKQTPDESVALRMLLAELEGQRHLLRLIIYDNSPEPQGNLLHSDITKCLNVVYWHDRQNGRILAAYSYALDQAVKEGVPWLMLLDQDTEVTAEYLEEVLRLSSEEHPGICAITPRLIVHGEQKSPHLLEQRRASDKSPFAAGALPTGRSKYRVGAWNSGAIIRVRSLIAAGGFPEEFPLDNLDYAMFHRLQQAGERVFIMESSLHHQLSVADLHTLSAARLRGKLASDILLQRRLQHRTRVSLAVEFLRTGLSLLRKLPDKRMGLTCLRFSLVSLFMGKRPLS